QMRWSSNGEGVVRKSVLTLVALLRGINVGKAKRLAMSDLRSVAEGLGWQNVATLLATGNLVFTTSGADSANVGPRLAQTLEKALASKYGLTTRVVVLSAREIEEVLDEMPFGPEANTPSRLMVAAYVDPGAPKKLEPLMRQDWSPGALALGRHAAYMWCPDGILDSLLVTAVARATRDGLTARNWSTWQKIHRLAAATSTPAAGHRSKSDLSAG
ncbi:MAG: DUF1697 domain-containing protein, partial [Vicinamibacterales bacterium]